VLFSAHPAAFEAAGWQPDRAVTPADLIVG
jgi:hypothetical protein